MRTPASARSIDAATAGTEIYERIVQLYPICRSITGDGFRRTLEIIRADLDLTVHEVPSGTRVFDWTVPKEWNIRDAYIKNSRGERIVDFAKSNLHVVSYSVPVHAHMPLAELKPHLFALPEHPDWIPYRTGYYTEQWGFCVTQRQLDALPDGVYEVCIDSSLTDGHLTYGEGYLPGASPDEILISCHACHPSLCNDNLSGVALAAVLAKSLATSPRWYSYRLLFIPGTIGSITWLARNEATAARIKHGLVLSCLGDAGSMSYKRSRDGNADIDRAVSHVLRHADGPHEIRDFSPWGYDERQYCSPGFNLPVGLLSRTPHGRFPEYHTSADNLEFVQPAALGDSFVTCRKILDVLEHNRRWINQNPKCEPQLGRRGIYRAVGGQSHAPSHETAMLWVLSLSDGRFSLLDIADRAGLDFDVIKTAADTLAQHGLLAEADGDPDVLTGSRSGATTTRSITGTSRAYGSTRE